MAAPVTINGTTFPMVGDDGAGIKIPRINDIIYALVALLNGTSAVAWNNVTFTNSWVNFGGSVQTVQYRKIGDVVYIRGAGKTGTINLSAFTLPSGYRPPAILGFPATSNSAFGHLVINTDGTVVPATGSNTSFFFTCSFSVTA